MCLSGELTINAQYSTLDKKIIYIYIYVKFNIIIVFVYALNIATMN